MENKLLTDEKVKKKSHQLRQREMVKMAHALKTKFIKEEKH